MPLRSAALIETDGLRRLLAGKLEKGVENPFSCCVLAGQRSTDERRRNLAAFKEGDIRFLVCTDVAARGLDIAELPYVINMTLPDKEEDYVHRVGRVGRADVMGLAISLVSTRHKEKVWYYDKRKWEGKALSTKLASEGGCCIWYDEPSLLKGVQTRLGTTIETLDAFLRQPGGVSNPYGQAKEGGLNDETAAHLAQLAPEIAQLAALETQAQLAYFRGSALSALRKGGAAEGRPIAAAGGGAAGGGAAGGGAAGGGAAGGGAAGGTPQKKALELSEPMDTEAAPKSSGHHKGGGGRGAKGGAGGAGGGGRCAPGKRGRQ